MKTTRFTLSMIMLFLISCLNEALGQWAVGIGTETPHFSAAVDITSTTKGFLPPRMTNVELQAISNPADGLIVFCTDCDSNGSGALSVFIAGYWYNLCVNISTTLPSAPIEGTHETSETQIIWNWNTVPGATGYKWNSVNIYETAEDMGSSTSKTEPGLTGSTPYTRYVWAYNANGNSISTTLTSETTGVGWACGTPIQINHVAGSVAPVTKTVTYGTVNNIPGELTKCWITSNLGSDQQATALSDATEESAGWYWQFNMQQGYKHTDSARTPNTTWIISISEDSQWLIANDPCALLLGSGWRLPTYTEWANVDAGGNWTDWNHPWNSALKIHAAGYLFYSTGSTGGRGSSGYYWSSTQDVSTHGWYLDFRSGGCNMSNYFKSYGFSARCLRD